MKINKQAPESTAGMIKNRVIAIVTLSPEGKIREMSQPQETITGIAREKLIGSDFADYFSENQKARKIFQELFAKGTVTDFPLRFRHQDGKLADVLFNGSVYKDDQGMVLGAIVILSEIAGPARDEAQLNKCLKELSDYKGALDESSIVAITDKNGIITYANDNFCKVSKYRREELIGQDHFLINSGYHSKEFIRDLWDTISSGKAWHGELKNKAKDGSNYWVDTTIVPFLDDAGKPYQYVAIRRDITDQKLLSNYSLSLIEASLDPLVTINPEGKITDLNQATVDITGIERSKLIGSDFLDYFTEPQKAREVYQEVFAKGSVADSPLTLRHQDGNLTDVLFNGSVYKDDLGKILGVVVVARDVTAQKQASQYARSLIEASLDPLITISTDGKIMDVNEAKVNITGLERELLVGTNFYDYFTEPQKAREVYQEVFAKGAVADYPLTFRHKSGKLIDVLFNGSVYKDAWGNVLGAVVVARDVTSQKQASQYARSLLEASLDPLVTISADGKITDVNEASVKVTGIEREKLIGTDFSNYFIETEKAQEGYRQVFEKGFVADYPLTIKHKNGKLTDVLYNASVYKDEKGNVLGVFAAARDVSAQKQASQYARSLIEASLDPLVTISADGKITDVNEASVKVTGIEREKLIGTDFSNYFTETEKAREGYRQVFEKGFVADYPLTIKHKNGKLTDVLYNASVYKDEKGNVLGVFAAARDVTEQKRIATELTQAKVFAELATKIAEEAKIKAESATQIAEAAVKSKQQFLSNMSHEIRTPMNAIIGFTKVVLKTKLNKKQEEYLNAIKTSGDALIVLINDILDLAKVNAGKMTFEQTPFKLSASITAMLHIFETKIQEKNLELVKEYDPAIPEVIVGDPVRLHQVILNLLGNAVKFTSEGKITVSVKLLEEDAEKVTIEFAITDTGIGIPENKLENIFENFQQASSGTSRIFGGTGLGLAIVKQLVEPQGGTISVKSKEGVGSTFSFVLSFKKTKAKAELETDLVVERVAGLKDVKILVVEDMALNQLLMKTLLEDFGFELDIAGNGKIAIEKMQENTYDIILMDLQMPVMNGFEATDHIRNIMKSKVPIIALTADVTTVDVAKCKAVGMNDYISKPVDDKVLYSKIIKYLKKTDPGKNTEPKKEESLQSHQKKCTNLEYLKRLSKNNPGRIIEMISIYLQETSQLINTMREALADKKWESLRISAHSLIPFFSTVGLDLQYEMIAKKIQDYANSFCGNQIAKQDEAETIANIQELISKIETISTQVNEELQTEMLALKKS